MEHQDMTMNVMNSSLKLAACGWDVVEQTEIKSQGRKKARGR